MTTPAIMLGLLTLPALLVRVLARISGQGFPDLSSPACAGLASVLSFTGLGHFIRTEALAQMLPDWVPAPTPLIYVTGVVELSLAALVLRRQTREAAGWAILVMLLLFLPVNVYAAVSHVGPGGHQWGPIYLLIRVPLQAILIGWTWWFAVRPYAGSPISFSCRATLALEPVEIANQILDTGNWTDFTGYGPLPGIALAEFEVRTPDVVGSRILVQNRDGSRHVEEILEWAPDRRLKLRLHEFSPPMSRLAKWIDETWEFRAVNGTTRVTRTLDIENRSILSRAPLLLISQLLKRAIARHLKQMRSDR